MKKLTTYVLIILLSSSCIEGKKHKPNDLDTNLTKNKINIDVKFNAQKKEHEVNLNFIDTFNDTQSFAIGKDDTAHHNFIINSDQPVFLMDWTINQVYYVLYPDEKITIQPTTDSVRFLGVNSSVKDQIRKNELFFFQSLNLMERSEVGERINKILGEQSLRVGRTGEMKSELLLLIELAKFRKSKDANGAYNYIRNKFDNRINFLNKYKEKHVVSDRFYQLVTKLFQFDFESSTFQILKGAIVNNSKIGKELNEIATHKITTDSVNWLFIPTYQRKLINYLSYSYLKHNITDTKGKLMFINKMFTGDVRNFCAFILLKKQDKILSFSATKEMQEVFGHSGEKYFNYIKKNQEFYADAGKSLSSKNTQIQSFAGLKANFSDIINNQRNKVILLDFWASWCKPCKTEMPFSKQLLEDFKGKNVSFIYLSLDKNYNDWFKDATSLQLKENSFIVNANFNSKLVEDLKIKTIPRYVLIDKHGTMVDLDAPRPSDPALKKKIQDLLK